MTKVFVTASHRLDFVTSPVLFSEEHGCVYGVAADLDSDGDVLLVTPQNIDGTWSEDEDDWVEVDHMALLGEEEAVRAHVDDVFQLLQRQIER